MRLDKKGKSLKKKRKDKNFTLFLLIGIGYIVIIKVIS